MHHFEYRGGRLFCEGVALDGIAEAVGTPTYVYSAATLRRHYTVFRDALATPHARIFYAVKANGNLGVLATLAALGAGADVVSEGEIRKALAAGVPAGAMVFSGVGKTAEELAFAVRAGLYQINVESEGELALLSSIAAREGRRQAVALRVNPDVGAGGHAKITTGSSANKFGISFEEAERLYVAARALPGLEPVGLAAHIGSQIFELSSMEAAFAKLAGLVRRLRASGHGVTRLDLGGGIGIPYDVAPGAMEGPDRLADYAAMIRRVTAGLDVELGFEPGRLIVGNAGVLLTRALYINPRPDRRFLVVDAGMNDLVRPAMYDAHHEFWPLTEPRAGAPRIPYEIVGPICESSDQFASGRPLPETAPGDLLAVMSAGAYGAAMASTYNQRRLPAEVLVDGDRFAVTRPRQTYDDLLGGDRMPDWLAPPARLSPAA